jgi:hypothetical protein
LMSVILFVQSIAGQDLFIWDRRKNLNENKFCNLQFYFINVCLYTRKY